MTNQEHGDSPPDGPESNPLEWPPAPPTSSKVREGLEGTAHDEAARCELAREFRWAEVAQIGSSIVLAIVGIIALCIYNGQLGEMRKSTKAAQDAAHAAKESVDLTRKQMEGISAAVIEITKGVSVSFPVAPFGETRLSLRSCNKTPTSTRRG